MQKRMQEGNGNKQVNSQVVAPEEDQRNLQKDAQRDQSVEKIKQTLCLKEFAGVP